MQLQHSPPVIKGSSLLFSSSNEAGEEFNFIFHEIALQVLLLAQGGRHHEVNKITAFAKLQSCIHETAEALAVSSSDNQRIDITEALMKQHGLYTRI